MPENEDFCLSFELFPQVSDFLSFGVLEFFRGCTKKACLNDMITLLVNGQLVVKPSSTCYIKISNFVDYKLEVPSCLQACPALQRQRFGRLGLRDRRFAGRFRCEKTDSVPASERRLAHTLRRLPHAERLRGDHVDLPTRHRSRPHNRGGLRRTHAVTLVSQSSIQQLRKVAVSGLKDPFLSKILRGF